MSNQQTPRSLAEELKLCRTLSGLTMRQVEEATGVSNAYLSQLETGKIKIPSANVLYKLASLYGTSLDVFLIAAGIIVGEPGKQSQNVLTTKNLTKEGEQQLLEYLQFLRSKKI